MPLIFNLCSTYTAVTYNQLANILHFPFRKVKSQHFKGAVANITLVLLEI